MLARAAGQRDIIQLTEPTVKSFCVFFSPTVSRYRLNTMLSNSRRVT